MISLASALHAFLAKYNLLIFIALSVASLAVLISGNPILSIRLPISLGLAGNLFLNFSGIRGDIWIWLSLATAIFASVALVWAAIDRLRWRYRNGEGKAA